MNGSFRQSMAWLHAWAGLVAGWLLFAICVTGTAAYYRDEISLWMRPELHEASRRAAQTAPVAAQAQRAAADTALAMRTRTAPQADRWIIDLPTARQPLATIHWSDPAGRILTPGAGRPSGNFQIALIDPRDGALAPLPRATRGGDFFYGVHFTLHYLPVRWGRWIVGASAMFMLVVLVSGVVTHRRIFSDFFTFRPAKGARSWLDAHNVFSVLSLPYHLMITYSGLVALMFLLFPWGVDATYGNDKGRFFGEVLPQAPRQVPEAGRPAPLAPVAPMLAAASLAWHGANIGRITVLRPGDANAVVVVARGDIARMSQHRLSMSFDGINGQLLSSEGDPRGTVSRLRGIIYGLHLGRFAEGGLRALFFLGGVACSAMVATGLLLWAAKRRARTPRWTEGMNIGVIAGLPLAVAVFFAANRLLPVHDSGRAAGETDLFFSAWASAIVAGFWRPGRRMWATQFAIGAAAFVALPWLRGWKQGLWLLSAADTLGATALLLSALGLALAYAAYKSTPKSRCRTSL